MNTNSNSYTIIYASVMVVIVAFLLAFVSSSLKATQDKNVQLDTKKQILAALNIKNVEDADAEYQKYVKGDMLMNVDGTLTENTGEFATNYEKEVKEHQRLHVFVCDVDGQTKYVVPVYGAGLWGGIWGYVALNEDKDTVYGVYFSHASETPGLGTESPITMAGSSLAVTASAEQIPSTCTVTGLSIPNGAENTSLFFFENSCPIFFILLLII